MNVKNKKLTLISASLILLSIYCLLHFKVFSFGTNFSSLLLILAVVALVLFIDGLTRFDDQKRDERE